MAGARRASLQGPVGSLCRVGSPSLSQNWGENSPKKGAKMGKKGSNLEASRSRA